MTEISTKYYISTIPRLDPVIKEEWIEWLLSEKYEGKQGQEALKRDGKFCCLGVYCEEQSVPKRSQVEDGQVVTYFGDDSFGSKGFIPRGYRISYANPEEVNVLQRDGYRGSETVFEAKTPVMEDDKQLMAVSVRFPFSLPILNDDDFTFAQIADVIRYFL